MLSHCANSQCVKPFLRLGQGKLFLVEAEAVAKSGKLTAARPNSTRMPPHRLERYWLCDRCASLWNLVHDRSQGIILVASARPPAARGVAVKQFAAPA
jgi:hypothetical protein